MKIGQAAGASGVSAKMIRHYEKIGLIGRTARSDGNYREFTDRDVADLKLIHHARAVGLAVEDILSLLALWRDAGGLDSTVRKAAARQHLLALQQKSASLTVLMKALQPLLEGQPPLLGATGREVPRDVHRRE